MDRSACRDFRPMYRRGAEAPPGRSRKRRSVDAQRVDLGGGDVSGNDSTLRPRATALAGVRRGIDATFNRLKMTLQPAMTSPHTIISPLCASPLSWYGGFNESG